MTALAQRVPPPPGRSLEVTCEQGSGGGEARAEQRLGCRPYGAPLQSPSSAFTKGRRLSRDSASHVLRTSLSAVSKLTSFPAPPTRSASSLRSGTLLVLEPSTAAVGPLGRPGLPPPPSTQPLFHLPIRTVLSEERPVQRDQLPPWALPPNSEFQPPAFLPGRLLLHQSPAPPRGRRPWSGGWASDRASPATAPSPAAALLPVAPATGLECQRHLLI